MKKIHGIKVLACCMALTGLITGCISMDYKPVSGTSLQPLKEDARAEIYYEKTQIPVPVKEQILVGDITASSSTSSHTLLDIKRKLLKTAREHGANVVLIKSIDHQQSGQARSDQIKNLNAPSWTPVDDSTSDGVRLRDMDLYNSNKDSNVPVYKITVKAQFIKIPDHKLPKEMFISHKAPVSKKPAAQKKTQLRVH